MRNTCVKTMAVASVVVALATGFAGVARAGGGFGGGGTVITGSLCYLVNGADQTRVVTITDQFGEQSGVRIGKARLLCTPATVTLEEGEFDEVVGLADHAKCYALQEKGANNPDVTVNLTDPVDIEEVRVGPARYLCLGAVKEVVTP